MFSLPLEQPSALQKEAKFKDILKSVLTVKNTVCLSSAQVQRGEMSLESEVQ